MAETADEHSGFERLPREILIAIMSCVLDIDTGPSRHFSTARDVRWCLGQLSANRAMRTAALLAFFDDYTQHSTKTIYGSIEYGGTLHCRAEPQWFGQKSTDILGKNSIRPLIKNLSWTVVMPSPAKLSYLASAWAPYAELMLGYPSLKQIQVVIEYPEGEEEASHLMGKGFCKCLEALGSAKNIKIQQAIKIIREM